MVSPTLDAAEADPRCDACGFLKHQHGPLSLICPVLVKGMLTMFRMIEVDPTLEEVDYRGSDRDEWRHEAAEQQRLK